MKIKTRSFIFMIVLAFVLSISSFVLFANQSKAENVVRADEKVVSISSTVTGTTDFTLAEVNATNNFYNLISATSGELTVTVYGDFTINSTLIINTKTSIISNGNYTISRSGNFVMVENHASLTFGASGNMNMLILDGANQPESIIKHLVNNSSKSITVHKLTLLGNGSNSPTFAQENVNDYGAFYNAGYAIINNMVISNFHAKNGAGIYNASGAQGMTIEQVSINGCIAEDYGSAIYNAGTTMTIKKASIYENTSKKGGTIANYTTMNLGDSSVVVDETNLNLGVNIYNNVVIGNGAGVLNGARGSNATMTINNTEIYSNRADGEQSVLGGAIANYATMTINFAYIHDNLTRCSKDTNNIAVSAGAGIYNDGDGSTVATCNINGGIIRSNSSSIYNNSDFTSDIRRKSATCNSFGAGLANFGVATISCGKIENNNAIEGYDVWVGTPTVSQNASKLTFELNLNNSSKTISLGLFYINSLQSQITLKNIKNAERFYVSEIGLDNGIALNSNVMTINNCNTTAIDEILSEVNNIYAFKVDGTQLKLNYILQFEIIINGTAEFAEELRSSIISVKVKGQSTNLDALLAENSGTIVYTWYYYPINSTNKRVIKTTTAQDNAANYVIGTGFVGQKVYVTATINIDGYKSFCQADGQSAEIERREMVARWGCSADSNWDERKRAFEYTGEEMFPFIYEFTEDLSNIPNFDLTTDVLQTMGYGIAKNPTNEAVASSINAGSYKITATPSVDDITIQNPSFVYTISPKVVSVPVVTGTEKKFNFGSQSVTYSEIDPEIVEVSGESAVNMGTYTIIFTLADSVNYIWEDGSNSPIYVKWSIVSPIPPIVLILIALVIVLMVAYAVYQTIRIKKREERKRANINTDAISRFNKK